MKKKRFKKDTFDKNKILDELINIADEDDLILPILDKYRKNIVDKMKKLFESQKRTADVVIETIQNYLYHELRGKIYFELPLEFERPKSKHNMILLVRRKGFKEAAKFFIEKYSIDITVDFDLVLRLLEGEVETLNQSIINLECQIKTYRNQKGKEWREELIKLAITEYQNNELLDKTKALKTAFEKLPNKEIHRQEFDLKFGSILRKLYKTPIPSM